MASAQAPEFAQHQGHTIIITLTKPTSRNAGAYRCVTCNKHLAWIPRKERQ